MAKKLYAALDSFDDLSKVTALECKDSSLTQQNQKEDADINTIVKRFGLTGQLPQGVRVPSYGDFSGVFDFQSAQNAIALADQSFMAMPADVRARFSNDPQVFLEFCCEEKDGKLVNLEEMRKLGLAVPKAESGDASVVAATDGGGAASAGVASPTA